MRFSVCRWYKYISLFFEFIIQSQEINRQYTYIVRKRNSCTSFRNKYNSEPLASANTFYIYKYGSTLWRMMVIYAYGYRQCRTQFMWLRCHVFTRTLNWCVPMKRTIYIYIYIYIYFFFSYKDFSIICSKQSVNMCI